MYLMKYNFMMLGAGSRPPSQALKTGSTRSRPLSRTLGAGSCPPSQTSSDPSENSPSRNSPKAAALTGGIVEKGVTRGLRSSSRPVSGTMIRARAGHADECPENARDAHNDLHRRGTCPGGLHDETNCYNKKAGRSRTGPGLSCRLNMQDK